MGCEAHPDIDGRTFECSGDITIVFDPYFVDRSGLEFPHWNGAQAFQPQGLEVSSNIRPTQDMALTDTPGRLQANLAIVHAMDRESA